MVSWPLSKPNLLGEAEEEVIISYTLCPIFDAAVNDCLRRSLVVSGTDNRFLVSVGVASSFPNEGPFQK